MDQEVLEERQTLCAVLAHEGNVVAGFGDTVEKHAPMDAALNGGWLVQREVDARGAPQQRQNLPRIRLFGKRDGQTGSGSRFGGADVGMTADADQFTRDVLRRKNEIYAPGGDGAS